MPNIMSIAVPGVFNSKGKANKEDLYPLLATVPLELGHMDFLTIENPGHNGLLYMLCQSHHYHDSNSKNYSFGFLEPFHCRLQFPRQIVEWSGQEFGSNLIRELCCLAKVRNIRTAPYHPKTNDQCEHFNSTLISMISTLEDNKKSHWKDYQPTLVHAYNCTTNNGTDFSLYYLMFSRKPRLPNDKILTNIHQISWEVSQHVHPMAKGTSELVLQVCRLQPTEGNRRKLFSANTK